MIKWAALTIFCVMLYVYFSYSIVLPYAEQQLELLKKCEQRGGVIVSYNKDKVCIKKEFLITDVN